MQQLRVSNEFLDDRDALGNAFDEDGYLFFRGVLDTSDITTVRNGVMSWAKSKGLISVEQDRPVWSGHVPELAKQPLDLQGAGLWQWLAERPSMRAMYQRIWGEQCLVLPLTEFHYQRPGQPALVPAHQDEVFNTGLDYIVCWIPLMEIPEELGGLAIAAGHHKRGSLHPDLISDTAPEDLFIPADAIPAEAWCRADYQPGDLLMFGGYTPHRGLKNDHPELLRLSLDFRVKPLSANQPIVGTLTAVSGDTITIIDGNGQEQSLVTSASTLLRAAEYDGSGDRAGGFGATSERPSLEWYIGKRVVAAAEDGKASLLRTPFGPAYSAAQRVKAEVMSVPGREEPSPLRDFVTDMVFGQIWARPGLSRRDRRWVTLTCVCGADAVGPITDHIYAALNSGDITLAEMREFALHFAIYCGWPKASQAENTTSSQWIRICDERGVQPESEDYLPVLEGLSSEEQAAVGQQEFLEVNVLPPPPVDTPYHDAVVNYVFGHVWRRPLLSRRERRLIAIAGCALSDAALSYHVYSALKSRDLTLEEMQEVALQFAAYYGVAKGEFLDGMVLDSWASIIDGELAGRSDLVLSGRPSLPYISE